MTAEPAPQDSIAVGDIRLTFLPDGEAHFSPTLMFPASNEAAWQAHRGLLDNEDRYVTTLGGFLIETGTRKIIVDLGLGDVSLAIPDFMWARGGCLLKSLEQAGVSPQQVDTVIYTHMHSDHAGWTTSGDEQALTFAGARHLVGRGEWEFWRDNLDAAFAPDAESVLSPLKGRIDTASDGQVIAPGVNLRATPGHTPGHQSVIISSGSARAVILGDVLHCPAQIVEPEWSVPGDIDPDLARQTRERLLAELEGSETIVGCSHFPETVFGRVLQTTGKRSWQIG